MASTTLIVDGDQYIYRTAAALEKNVDWGDGIHTLYADDREGRSLLDLQLNDLMTSFEASRMVLCLSDVERNFRKELYPPYKENRTGLRRPLIHGVLREHIKEAYEYREIDGLEADDVMGIMGTRDRKGKGSETIILVSDDKDLMQIPGLLFRPIRKSEGILRIDPEAASRFFYYQTLVGDRADNYPGCQAIGSARANRILDAAIADGTPLWDAVLGAFKAIGQTEEEALTQARCARILQSSDFDFKLRRPKLWHPEPVSGVASTPTRPATQPKKAKGAQSASSPSKREALGA